MISKLRLGNYDKECKALEELNQLIKSGKNISFVQRENSYANWFVDGRSFMQHAANMMEIAKKEIFITGWWLNPQILLKRPSTNDDWHLDHILERKAQEGVNIFILTYRENTAALELGSLHMEKRLRSCHGNIKVLRHPDHLFHELEYASYAHHEKLIVVDQMIAFVGGIDLAYGRWDDHEHRMTDLAGIGTPMNDEAEVLELDQIKTAYHEFMSNEQGDLAASSSSDLSCSAQSSTSQKWNFSRLNIFGRWKQSRIKKFEIRQGIEYATRKLEWKNEYHLLQSKTTAGTGTEFWIGKDYGNAFLMDLPEPEKAFEDFIDRKIVPRMPWHDISSVVYGDAAKDVAQHFIQRWNFSIVNLVRDLHLNYPKLILKSDENLQVPDVFRRMAMPCETWVLRSCSKWSIGLPETEATIQSAYCCLIFEAKHYIYIENQFFISQLEGIDVHNKIAKTLILRILDAHSKNETFRVYIVLPLLPGFTKSSGSMRNVLHYTYTSISKGPTSLINGRVESSLIGMLKLAIGDDYKKYITFCGLRKHDQLNEKLVTEIIYVHSKLIIVDDQFAIIGSANINDRSLMGDRDSEVAVYVEDTQFMDSVMNGQPYKAGIFAGSLRQQLFQEHLGLLNLGDSKDQIDVSDPISPTFWDHWNQTAKINTEIFEQVFNCAPSDKMATLEDWTKADAQENLAATDKSKSIELLKGVQGHLVQFPMEFLSNVDLLKVRFKDEKRRESLLPSFIWT